MLKIIFFSLKGTIEFQKQEAAQSAVLVRQFNLNPLDRKRPYKDVDYSNQKALLACLV